MPSNELAVIIRRFQRAGKPFYLYKIDGTYAYINEDCEITYMTDGLNIEGRVKTGHVCSTCANWVYIPYKSIVEVSRIV